MTPPTSRIAKRRNDGAQEAGFDADVAVADEEEIVARFAGHAAKLVDLVACAERLGTDQQANRTLRKIARSVFDGGNRGIALVGNAKKNFEFGIILAAETRKVFVCFAVEAANGFQDADGRREISRLDNRRRGDEKTRSGKNRERSSRRMAQARAPGARREFRSRSRNI